MGNLLYIPQTASFYVPPPPPKKTLCFFIFWVKKEKNTNLQCERPVLSIVYLSIYLASSTFCYLHVGVSVVFWVAEGDHNFAGRVIRGGTRA